MSIALIRLLTVYAFDGRVWLSDLLVGVIFVAVGIVAWTKRIDRRRPGAVGVTEARQVVIVGSGPAGLTAAIYSVPGPAASPWSSRASPRRPATSRAAS